MRKSQACDSPLWQRCGWFKYCLPQDEPTGLFGSCIWSDLPRTLSTSMSWCTAGALDNYDIAIWTVAAVLQEELKSLLDVWCRSSQIGKLIAIAITRSSWSCSFSWRPTLLKYFCHVCRHSAFHKWYAVYKLNTSRITYSLRLQGRQLWNPCCLQEVAAVWNLFFWLGIRSSKGLRLHSCNPCPYLPLFLDACLTLWMCPEFGLSDLSALLWTAGIFNVGARQTVVFWNLLWFVCIHLEKWQCHTFRCERLQCIWPVYIIAKTCSLGCTFFLERIWMARSSNPETMVSPVSLRTC